MKMSGASPSVVLAGVIAAVAVVSIVVLGTIAFPATPTTSQTTQKTSSTTSAQAPIEPPLYHEDCALLNSTGATTCSSSISKEGEIQVFNMTTWSPTDFQSTYAFHTQYFGVQVNQSTSLQYSIDSAHYQAGVQGYFNVGFLVYYVNQTGTPSQTLATYASSGKVLVNQTLVEEFTGAVRAPTPGLYILVFPPSERSAAGAIRLVIQDASVVQDGIRFSFGTPVIRNLYLNEPSQKTVQDGFEEWPVTVYSNTTTNVVLNATSINGGVWIAFDPASLSGVGPGGVNTTMFMAGAVSDSSNLSAGLFVNGFGSNGMRGETYLPIALGSPVSVLSGPGKFDNLQFAVYQNQTGEDTVGMVYSPPVGQSRLPLHVSVNVTGMLENGTVTKLPNWLQVSSQASSFYLDPNQPFYFFIRVNATAQAPLGTYTIVLNETVNAQVFSGFLLVTVQKPILL
ncbi:MAG: hypothetical protein JRM99_03445 [Nitrososphaerota archaeon]|nr:hypothetical protein [Nitrososphaerota archaeon]